MKWYRWYSKPWPQERTNPLRYGAPTLGLQLFFFKWANPGPFFFYFRSFQTNITTIFTTNICGKNVHPVYGAGIRTHDLRNVSLFPLPLDQGSRPKIRTIVWNYFFVALLFVLYVKCSVLLFVLISRSTKFIIFVQCDLIWRNFATLVKF